MRTLLETKLTFALTLAAATLDNNAPPIAVFEEGNFVTDIPGTEPFPCALP